SGLGGATQPVTHGCVPSDRPRTVPATRATTALRARCGCSTRNERPSGCAEHVYNQEPTSGVRDAAPADERDAVVGAVSIRVAHGTRGGHDPCAIRMTLTDSAASSCAAITSTASVRGAERAASQVRQPRDDVPAK